MKPELLPGGTLDEAKQILESCRTAGLNLRGKASPPDRLLSDYLSWCRSSADRLARLLNPRSVDALFLTATYWAMLKVQGAGDIVSTTVHAEIDARARDLEAGVQSLGQEAARWGQGFRPYIVLDTSVFIEHKDEFPASLAAIEERIQPASVDLGQGAALPVQFVIPLQVIDELDKTKADRSRGRAQLTLARLNTIITDPAKSASVEGLRDGSYLHLLLDDPGHNRLPLEDDEIVDRALYLEGVAGPDAVGIACLDTGMHLRARVAGLQSHLLADDRRPEKPANARSERRA